MDPTQLDTLLTYGVYVALGGLGLALMMYLVAAFGGRSARTAGIVGGVFSLLYVGIGVGGAAVRVEMNVTPPAEPGTEAAAGPAGAQTPPPAEDPRVTEAAQRLRAAVAAEDWTAADAALTDLRAVAPDHAEVAKAAPVIEARLAELAAAGGTGGSDGGSEGSSEGDSGEASDDGGSDSGDSETGDEMPDELLDDTALPEEADDEDEVEDVEPQPAAKTKKKKKRRRRRRPPPVGDDPSGPDSPAPSEPAPPAEDKPKPASEPSEDKPKPAPKDPEPAADKPKPMPAEPKPKPMPKDPEPSVPDPG